jgi:hypothetical protein
LSLDCRDEWRTLEQSAGKSLKGARKLSFSSWKFVMEANNADVLLSGSLLGLDETGRAIDADDEAASDLGVKGAAVTSLLDSVIMISSRDTRRMRYRVRTSACA